MRVIDCYSISPIDVDTLLTCLDETAQPILIPIEDHFIHGGMGDFAIAALEAIGKPHLVIQMGITEISRSGKMEELPDHAGISAAKLVKR